MDETQQRIKIAEDQGYFNVKENPLWPSELCGTYSETSGDYYGIPDYLNDLNAMHDVLSELNEVDQNTFCITLWAILETGGDESFDSINATAKQRAEAYLRTKGIVG